MFHRYKLESLLHPSKQLLIKTINGRDWREACTLLYNDDTWAHIKDKDGNYPIHLAVKLGCTNELIILLLTAFPAAIKERDKDGNLPVHLLSYHHRGKMWINLSEITASIINHYLEGLNEFDRDNNIPIHIAIRNRGPDELLRYLFLAFTDCAKVPDKHGNLPIHLCCQYEVNFALFTAILRAYPNAASTPNVNGLTPLHKACHFNASVDVLSLLLSVYPAAASTKDKRGNLPLHLLYLNFLRPPEKHTLNVLLQHYPNALSVTNHNGCVPLMMMGRQDDKYADEYL